METVRLRAMRKPSRLESLLGSLVRSRNWVVPGAETTHDASELPSALQKTVREAEKTGGAWRVWINPDGRRLFVAEFSVDLSRERGIPVLQVRHYDDSGTVQEYSLWAQLADNTWQQCTL